MYSHTDSVFFDSFLCAHPECQEQNPKENTLLNCFHTVCNVHLQHIESINCPNEECTFTLEGDSSLGMCKNPISYYVAKQLSGLKATRINGNKCKICSEEENISFCIECCSAWCESHRTSIHSKFGGGHEFVELSDNNEEFVREIMRRFNVPTTHANDELNLLIESLISRKDSMAINMVRFDNCMREFQDNTIRITEEAERDFDRIKKHIEQIKEENLEKLRIKSEEFVRELEEKIHILRLKGEATERALNIANSVKTSKMLPDRNFMQLLKESNSLQLNDRLTELSDSPREHVKVPRIVNKINKELVRLSSFRGCDPTQHYAQYCLGNINNKRYCINDCINPPPSATERIFFFYKFSDTTSNVADPHATIYYHDPKDSQETHSKMTISLPARPSAGEVDCYYVTFLPYHEISGNGNNNVITRISIEGISHSRKQDILTVNVCRTSKMIGKDTVSMLSTLSVEPGHLASLAKSRNKVFAVCKDANQIRRYDASPQIISPESESEPEEEESSRTVWNSEATFGVGHLIDPRGICVFQSVLFVSDCYHHAVLCFTTDGSFISKFGSRGSGKGQFERPMGMTVDRDKDRLIVADNGNSRIQFLLLGCYQNGWESFQVNKEIEKGGKPVDVKIDTLGSIFVLTDFGEILKYDRFYILCGPILYEDSICPLLPFFTIDLDDVIYVCSVGGRVYMITEVEDEADKYNIRGHPTIPKQLNLSGITVDENCRLFIAHNEPSEATDPTRSLVYVTAANI